MPRPARTEAPAQTPRAPRIDRPFLRDAAAIFAVALALRLLHVWLLSRSPYFTALLGDARSYDEWASRIAGGDWIGSEVFYQAPLYPYFLGTIYTLAGHSLGAVRVVQAVVGAGSCVFLGLAGYRLFSRRVGLIAGLALAAYAPAIFFDALLQKSVLDLFFVTLALWLIGRVADAPAAPRNWLALGLALGALSLTRENALVFVIVVLGWALLGPRRQPPRSAFAARLRLAALFLCGLAIVLVPVAVRNYAVGGGFYLTTAQMGPNFYIGNNPASDGTYSALRYGRGAPEYERQDATDLAELALGRELSPSEVSRYWMDQAFAFITGHPGAWLKLTARKAALLVNATEMLDTESQESHAEWSWVLRAGGWFGHFGLLVPLAAIGAVLAWKDRSRLAVLYVMTAAYAASVVLFYVFARYRMPLVPMLLLFAASGVLSLPAWIATADARARGLLAALTIAAIAVAYVPLLSASSMRAISESNLALALQEEGRLDEAAAHYRRAIEIQPDYAPAYNNLGVMQRSAGLVDEAIATYRKALELRGDYPDAHYNLANALLEKNRPAEAAEHFTIALRSIPEAASASNNLGIALAAQNRPEDAVDAFRGAVEAEPDSAVAHRNLADALESTGRVDEAIAEFRRAIELDPKDATARYNLAVVLIQAERPAEAIPELRTVLVLTPEAVDAYNNLGIALASTGDLDGAIGQFRRALSIDPSSAEARVNLEAAERARASAGAPARRK
ncbi:MAG: tetratricopeptide repeat protein [Vicinamibacterales bacterium]